MDSSDDILNEMREISPLLADAIRTTPYTLPMGYFEGLPGVILKKITDVPVLLPNTVNTYRVPEDYFENLSSRILSKIQNTGEVREELEAMAPLLNTISKEPVFSLPKGYFEQLQTNIQTLSGEQQAKTKLITFKNYRRWIQYAAAAMVAGVLVSGAFLFTDSKNYLEQEKKSRIIQQGVPDTAKDAGMLKQGIDSSEEIADNIFRNEKAEEEAMNTLSKSARPKSILELLSDEELKKYLEENAIPETIYPDTTEIDD